MTSLTSAAVPKLIVRQKTLLSLQQYDNASCGTAVVMTIVLLAAAAEATIQSATECWLTAMQGRFYCCTPINPHLVTFHERVEGMCDKNGLSAPLGRQASAPGWHLLARPQLLACSADPPESTAGRSPPSRSILCPRCHNQRQDMDRSRTGALAGQLLP